MISYLIFVMSLRKLWLFVFVLSVLLFLICHTLPEWRHSNRASVVVLVVTTFCAVYNALFLVCAMVRTFF